MLDDDPGAPVSEELVDGVLTLRIRSFDHTGDGDLALARWRDAHARHFAHDRIVVDVRGNPGGGSTFGRDWVRDHVPEPFAFVPGRRWLLDGCPLIVWTHSSEWSWCVVPTRCRHISATSVRRRTPVLR